MQALRRPPRSRSAQNGEPSPEPMAVYGLGFTDPVPVVGAWAAFNALQVLLAIFAFRLDGESLRPLWALPVQQFVYRQLMYLVVIEATISALVGIRGEWKTIPRTGDVQVQPG